MSKAALTRLRKELINFHKDPPPYLCVAVNEKNMLEWDYLLQGPEGTDYEGGEYHGRVKFPSDYPMAPPEICIYTPNGRFKINTPICMSMTNFHPEDWNPAWSVSTILKGLLSFMCEETHTQGAVEKPSKEERKALALSSKNTNLQSSVYRKRFPDGFVYPEKDEDEEEEAAASGEPAAEAAPASTEEAAAAPTEATSAAAAAAAPAPTAEIAVGSKVVLQGMSGRKELNGAAGTVQEIQGTRYHVELEGGEVVKLRKNTIALV